MPTESGDQKLLGNYRRLIDLVSADTNYNPANADITKAALAAHYIGSLAALDDVAAKNAPNKMATSDLRFARRTREVRFCEQKGTVKMQSCSRPTSTDLRGAG